MLRGWPQFRNSRDREAESAPPGLGIAPSRRSRAPVQGCKAQCKGHEVRGRTVFVLTRDGCSGPRATLVLGALSAGPGGGGPESFHGTCLGENPQKMHLPASQPLGRSRGARRAVCLGPPARLLLTLQNCLAGEHAAPLGKSHGRHTAATAFGKWAREPRRVAVPTVLRAQGGDSSMNLGLWGAPSKNLGMREAHPGTRVCGGSMHEPGPVGGLHA